MALSVCLACSTAYAVGLARCPHCQSPDSVEQGQPMPKITRQGGPTYEAAPTEEEPSPGNSSSPSAEKQQTSEQLSKPNPRPRARTTASRSNKGRKGGSTAASTDGPTTAEPS